MKVYEFIFVVTIAVVLGYLQTVPSVDHWAQSTFSWMGGLFFWHIAPFAILPFYMLGSWIHRASEQIYNTDNKELVIGKTLSKAHPSKLLEQIVTATVVEAEAKPTLTGQRVSFSFSQIEWASEGGVDDCISINGLGGLVWVDYASMVLEAGEVE